MKSLGVREMGRGVFGGCDARRQDTCWVCTHQTASFKSGDITQKKKNLVASVVDVRWLDFFFFLVQAD